MSLAASALIAGCGADKPKSAGGDTAEVRAALKDAPAELKKLESRSNRILEGGPSAFRRQIRALKGVPIVVNKWASWCGPCRFEFPFFQRLARKHAGKIAFVGVNSLDAKGDAKDFLRKYPVPYPSFFDPDGKVARLFRGERWFPATAFYDGKGELVYTKPGGYAAEAAIAKDIRQYIR